MSTDAQESHFETFKRALMTNLILRILSPISVTIIVCPPSLITQNFISSHDLQHMPRIQVDAMERLEVILKFTSMNLCNALRSAVVLPSGDA